MLIEVKTATENCAERCIFFRVDTTDLYANDEVYHRVHICKFYDICSKLYDRYKEAMMNELNKLEEYLKEHGIKYDRNDREKTEKTLDFHQIVVYDDEKPIWDVVCHTGSHGYEQGLLEIMGSIIPKETREAGIKVEGWLTADEIIKRMEA